MSAILANDWTSLRKNSSKPERGESQKEKTRGKRKCDYQLCARVPSYALEIFAAFSRPAYAHRQARINFLMKFAFLTNESRASRRNCGRKIGELARSAAARQPSRQEKIGNSKVNRGNSKTNESWDTRSMLNSATINYIKIQQVLARKSLGLHCRACRREFLRHANFRRAFHSLPLNSDRSSS